MFEVLDSAANSVGNIEIISYPLAFPSQMICKYWLWGNFREWSTGKTINNHPSNPQQPIQQPYVKCTSKYLTISEVPGKSPWFSQQIAKEHASRSWRSVSLGAKREPWRKYLCWWLKFLGFSQYNWLIADKIWSPRNTIKYPEYDKMVASRPVELDGIEVYTG